MKALRKAAILSPPSIKVLTGFNSNARPGNQCTVVLLSRAPRKSICA